MKRRTLNFEFLIEGIGLHKGKDNFVIVKPNIESKGIIFVNPDNGAKIELSVTNVSSTNRGTVISNGDFSVSTIEHLMSCFTAFEIDDAIIEIRGDEIPILDGSSIMIAELISKVGFVEKNIEADFFDLKDDFIYVCGESFYKVEKSEKFIIDCTYEHEYTGKQRFVFEVNEKNYIKEIAPARTFGFDYEIEYLRKNNLIRGGSLENAVVVTKNGVLNGSLRFNDEFVRHKILDLLGDLKLSNLRFRNIKITAKRPSHKGNIGLVKTILARRSFYEENTRSFRDT